MRLVVSPLARTLRETFNAVGWERTSTRLGIALLVVSGIFFAANFADKAWISYQVAQVRQQRLEQIQATTQQIQQLKHDLAYMHSRAYYVQAARHYGYIQPGDMQIQVISESSPPSPSVGDSGVAMAPTHQTSHESLLRRMLQAIVPGL